MSIGVESIDANGLLAFLECLKHNEISMNMLANYLAAIKAKISVLGLNASVLDDKRLKYYLRSLKLNRPVCLSTKNIISIETLQKIVLCCDMLYMGVIFKAVFLVAYFVFFSASPTWPLYLFIDTFDVSRHLAAGDVFFSKLFVKILIKWSKTFQTHDEIKVISLPRLGKSPLYPYRALKKALLMYKPSENQPLFQYKYSGVGSLLLTQKLERPCHLSIPNYIFHPIFHVPCFPAFRCLPGFHCQCPLARDQGAGHLDVGLRVEIYPGR